MQGEMNARADKNKTCIHEIVELSTHANKLMTKP